MTKIQLTQHSKVLKTLKFFKLPLPEDGPQTWGYGSFNLTYTPGCSWQMTHDKHKSVGSGNSPRDACLSMWNSCVTMREVERYAVPIPRIPLLIMHDALTAAVESLKKMGFHADTDAKPLPLLEGVPHAWCRGDVCCQLASDRSGWLTWKEDAPTVVGFSVWPKQSLYALQAAHAKEAERSLGHVQGLNFLLKQLDVEERNL
jgi:hypothetical protein